MLQLSRRRLLAVLALGGAGAPGRCGLAADGLRPAAAPSADQDMITADIQRAVDHGLAYLAGEQNQDGSFGSGHYGQNVAVCGLAGLALLAGGNTPGRGLYGPHVGRVVQLLLAHTQDSGFVIVPGASSHGPMYGHGFATLFLAEVYGMSPEPQLRDKLSRATRLIVDTQNPQGGWRYLPQSRDADISVTICQVMALRAARNAGMYVPNETIDRSIDYVKRSQNPDGGFMYMLPEGPSDFPRSAAGVVALYSAGVYAGDEIRRGLDYVMKFLPADPAAQPANHFFTRITTPRKPCGTRVAPTGTGGFRPSSACCSPSSRRMAGGSTRSALNTRPPWPR